MKKTLLSTLLLSSTMLMAQFNNSYTEWNIPNFETASNGANGLDEISSANHGLYDMDGDGKVDLVDPENTAGNVWSDGSQYYWKVYLNTGSGFSTTAIDWNIPNFETASNGTNGLDAISSETHGLMDFNGDGLLDFIDGENTAGNVWTDGSQHYWLVYLNTGEGFSDTGTQWNIPDFETATNGTNGLDELSGANHSLIDIDGDGKLDFVDAENTAGNVWTNGSQHYWMVYFNDGTEFSTTGTQWNIPDFETAANGTNGLDVIAGGSHGLFDLDGDGKLDFVDAENTAGNVWSNGSQHYWKVYSNTGSGFSATGSQWNIPDFETAANGTNGLDIISSANHGLYDLNGGHGIDFVDAENTAGNVWTNGSQHYWKVYYNTGSGFSSTGTQWNIPDFETAANGTNGLDAISGGNHGLYKMNHGVRLDFVDAENTAGNVWSSGSQYYWRVYFVENVGVSEYDQIDNGMSVYPNPMESTVTINFENTQQLDNGKVNVYNYGGQLVYSTNFSNDGINVIDVSSLASGVYVMEVVDSNNTYRQKIVKK